MMLQKCLINKGLLREELKQNRYFIFLLWIINICSSLIPSIMIYKSNIENHVRPVTSVVKDMIYMTNPLSIFIILVSAVVFAIIQFRYLYKTDSLIFYNTMPLTKNSLFFTKFFAGFLSILLSFLPVLVVNFIIGSFINEYEIGILLYTKIIITPILIGLFMYGTFVLTQIVSSNVFAMIIASATLLTLYPFMIWLIYGMFSTYLTTYYLGMNYTLLKYFYPYFQYANMTIFDEAYTLAFLSYILIAGIVLMFADLVIFKKRKSENTNKFFAFATVKLCLKYYITAIFSLFITMFVYSYNEDVVFSCVLGAISIFVVYSLVQSVFEKDLKNMFANKGKLAILIIILTALNLSFMLDILKLDKSLFTLTDATEFTLEFPFENHYGYVKIKNKESMDLVLDLVKNKTEQKTPHDYSTRLVIETPKYEKTGIAREFFIKESAIDDFCEALYDGKDNEFKKSFYRVGKKNILKNRMSVDYLKDSKYFDIANISLEKKLFKVLDEECLKYNYQDIKNSKLIYQISFDANDRWCTIPIYSCFTETIKLLDEYRENVITPEPIYAK